MSEPEGDEMDNADFQPTMRAAKKRLEELFLSKELEFAEVSGVTHAGVLAVFTITRGKLEDFSTSDRLLFIEYLRAHSWTLGVDNNWYSIFSPTGPHEQSKRHKK